VLLHIQEQIKKKKKEKEKQKKTSGTWLNSQFLFSFSLFNFLSSFGTMTHGIIFKT